MSAGVYSNDARNVVALTAYQHIRRLVAGAAVARDGVNSARPDVSLPTVVRCVVSVRSTRCTRCGQQGRLPSRRLYH